MPYGFYMAKERNDNQDGVHEDEVSVDGRAQVVDVADVPVMKGFADAVNAAVSRSVLSDCFSKFLGGENRDGFLYREVFEKNNSAMQQAFLLLNDLVVRFGFEKSILFKNEAIGKDLNKRFEEFVRRFDGDLDKVEEVIRGSEDCSNFSANWRENLKVAAYYVFLIHYGAKRKGEKDAKGDSQDYAYHPVASAVGNVVQKCRFFCEQTVIAAMLHDVLEDWPVGIAGLLNSSVEDLNPKFFGKDGPVWVPKAHAESLRERHGASFDKHFSWVCSSLGGVSGQPGNVSGAAVFFSRMVSIEALVKLVTKSGDNKARQIVEMFYGVLGHKRAQRFSAMRAIIIKISDRLDNTRTFIQKIRAGMSGGAEVSEEKFQEVAADTIYTFMACAVAMRMWNVADWLYDYLIFRDPDERERRIVLRSKRDRRDMGPVVLKDGQHWPGLKREFSAEFQDEMKREMMDSTMTEGVDYILNYRPVGFRYEDGEIAEDMARDGRYEQALQNFVIFRCVRNDPNMCFAAAEVFKRLFPKPLKHQWAGRGEFNSVLGRRLGENRMGVSTDEHSFSDKYGVGAWSVFRSPEEVSFNMLGLLNRGYFYSDAKAVECRARVSQLLSDMEGFITHLYDSYKILDHYRGGLDPNALRQEVLDRIARVTGSVDFTAEDIGLSWPDELEGVLDKLVMAMFMAKEKNVDVVVNGHNVSLKIPEFYIGRSGKDEAEASAAPGFLARLFGGDVFGGLSKQEKLMEKYERWAPLVFCAPWALGRPVEIIDVPAGRDGVPSIAYNVDFRGSFSKRQLAEQTEFLDWLLQQFKGELLTDEPWARNVVMQPSQKGIDEKLRRNRGRKKRKGAKRGMGNLPE